MGCYDIHILVKTIKKFSFVLDPALNVHEIPCYWILLQASNKDNLL